MKENSRIKQPEPFCFGRGWGRNRREFQACTRASKMFHPLSMDANTMKKMEKQNWAEAFTCRLNCKTARGRLKSYRLRLKSGTGEVKVTILKVGFGGEVERSRRDGWRMKKSQWLHFHFSQLFGDFGTNIQFLWTVNQLHNLALFSLNFIHIINLLVIVKIGWW